MRLAIDAMGGDNAPEEIVKGSLAALKANPQMHITLVGDEAKIKPLVGSEPRLSILHTPEKNRGDRPTRQSGSHQKERVHGLSHSGSERRARRRRDFRGKYWGADGCWVVRSRTNQRNRSTSLSPNTTDDQEG